VQAQHYALRRTAYTSDGELTAAEG